MRILITGDKGFVGTETKKYIESINQEARPRMQELPSQNEQQFHQTIP